MLQTAPRTRPATGAVTGDDYLTRMVKYIPAEIVGPRLVETLKA